MFSPNFIHKKYQWKIIVETGYNKRFLQCFYQPKSVYVGVMMIKKQFCIYMKKILKCRNTYVVIYSIVLITEKKKLLNKNYNVLRDSYT